MLVVPDPLELELDGKVVEVTTGDFGEVKPWRRFIEKSVLELDGTNFPPPFRGPRSSWTAEMSITNVQKSTMADYIN